MMTAKTLSWATFGLLTLGTAPIMADPSVAASSTSEYFNDRKPQPYSGTLPPCGSCSIENSVEFQKGYAIDPNTICPPEKPMRVIVRLATKVPCTGGSYWLCQDTSTMTCSVPVARPECPQDSCAK